MNHFKTFLFLLIAGIYTYSCPVLAQLERPLRPGEIKALSTNIQKDPSNVKSRLFLGNHYYRLSHWKKTIEYLNPIAEKLPDQEIYHLATAYLNTDDFRQSEAMIGMLLSRDVIKTDSYLLAIEVYSELLSRLNNAEQKGEVRSKLFETLKTVQKQNPENPKIYRVWLEKLEDHVDHYAFEALRVIEDMKKNNIRFDKTDFSLQCRLNYLAEFTKQTKATCLKAIQLDPNNPSNYIFLGQTHVNLGNEKKGKRMLASVGKKFSKSEEALWATANSYHESKNIGEAYKFYKKASLREDAQPRDFIGLAETAFELKKYGEALQAYTQHCFRERYLTHEFRRASGLLKDQPKWQSLYRQKMQDCKPKKLEN